MSSLDSLLPKLTDEGFDDDTPEEEGDFKRCYSVWKNALVTWEKRK